jgi:hypothetical protein
LQFAAGYLTFLAVGNLLCEILQLPLYQIFWQGTGAEIVFALSHCLAGDVLIGAASFGAAVLAWGCEDGPSYDNVDSAWAVVYGGKRMVQHADTWQLDLHADDAGRSCPECRPVPLDAVDSHTDLWVSLEKIWMRTTSRDGN